MSGIALKVAFNLRYEHILNGIFEYVPGFCLDFI
jgi:hypothetical protein